MQKTGVIWNPLVKLIISDVDETVADVYLPAKPEMIAELNMLLSQGIVIFFVSGAGLDQIEARVISLLDPLLRHKVLVSHCSGAEVWGYDQKGKRMSQPVYSLYDKYLDARQKHLWRGSVQEIISRFKLRMHPVMPIPEFLKKFGTNPLDIMFEDRGPQITLEFVNAYDMSDADIKQLAKELPDLKLGTDLRLPVLEYADALFNRHKLPINSRLGGVFALDFAIQGLSKTTSVKHVIGNHQILDKMGLGNKINEDPSSIEIWGDKFSRIRGGTDRHISEALPKEVRSIDFRHENPEEFPEGYNIVLWDGKEHLQDGLLEYLKTRHQ